MSVVGGWRLVRVTPGGDADDAAAISALPGDAWVDAVVPGSVGASPGVAGRWGPDAAATADDVAWWYRATFVGPDVPVDLVWERVATHARFHLDGVLVAESDNAFRSHRVPLATRPGAGHELLVRIAPLHETPVPRRPRERWRSTLVPDRSLRRRRTPLLGRIPTWAGAAPPVGLLVRCDVERRDRPTVAGVRTSLAAGGGEIAVDLAGDADRVRARLDGRDVPTAARPGPDGSVTVTLTVPDARRWWPHTHGEPVTYRLELDDDAGPLLAREVGFATIEADRSGGRFGLRVNDVDVFVRGAVWTPPDPVGWVEDPDAIAADLAALVDAGIDLVRVPGTGTYASDELCDATARAGILLWQDVALATFDPPDDEPWLLDVEAELRDRLRTLQGRPHAAVVCGGTETQQQPTLLGRPPDDQAMPVLDEVVPRVVAELLPGVVHVASSPSGGPLPVAVDHGVSHYFGVGAYELGLEDARAARVSFASECLAFAVPPERPAVRADFPGADPTGSDRWRRGVPADRGVDWDFADTTRHYTRRLFPDAARTAADDLDLQRAALVHTMTSTLAAWRSDDTPTRGAIVLAHRDLAPGPGWGLLDHRGHPKAPAVALADVCAPVALLFVDRGLDGLAVWAVNDTAEPLDGRLRLRAFAGGAAPSDDAVLPLEVPARGQREIPVEAALGGFRDLTWRWRFGAPAYRFLRATWETGEPTPAVDVTAALGPLDRFVASPTSGVLEATHRAGPEGLDVEVTAPDGALFVHLDVPGHRPRRGWIHLAPGQSARLTTSALGDDRPPPEVVVRSLSTPPATSVLVP